jgi:hypothetical protein
MALKYDVQKNAAADNVYAHHIARIVLNVALCNKPHNQALGERAYTKVNELIETFTALLLFCPLLSSHFSLLGVLFISKRMLCFSGQCKIVGVSRVSA